MLQRRLANVGRGERWAKVSKAGMREWRGGLCCDGDGIDDNPSQGSSQFGRHVGPQHSNRHSLGGHQGLLPTSQQAYPPNAMNLNPQTNTRPLRANGANNVVPAIGAVNSSNTHQNLAASIPNMPSKPAPQALSAGARQPYGPGADLLKAPPPAITQTPKVASAPVHTATAPSHHYQKVGNSTNGLPTALERRHSPPLPTQLQSVHTSTRRSSQADPVEKTLVHVTPGPPYLKRSTSQKTSALNLGHSKHHTPLLEGSANGEVEHPAEVRRSKQYHQKHSRNGSQG